MNTNFSQAEVCTQPELILDLCKHLARNDSALSNKLCKLAFGFLSSLTSSYVNTLSDEQCIIQQIKQNIAPDCNDCNLEKAELILSNICKSKVLQHKGAVLSFLLKLGNTGNRNRTKWTLIEEVEKLPSVSRIKTTDTSGESSQDSIKKLYPIATTCNNLQSKPSISQTSAISAFCYSRNNIETASSSKLNYNLVNEKDILQDVIYSLQGIESCMLIKEPGGVGFIIDPKCTKNLTEKQQALIERLLSIGFLHNQLKQYCDSNDKQSGIICQSLVAVLRDEFSDYYKTVTFLQSALDQNLITLRKALISIYDHRRRFEWLAYICEQCYDKKGGAVITAIHGFRQHGSKCAQEVSERVLNAVCKPLYVMLSRWLLDGEINDPYNEFFIEAKNINTVERLWHDKYLVRKSMVPSFITLEQAKKILATGKSINFLRQVCKDDGQLPGRDLLQQLFKNASHSSLFSPDECLEFHSILDKVYRETSLRVLDLLKNKFRLLEHLQSLRRYSLLGQGDFIRHLLELLASELDKPVQDIYRHTLTAILESAIRVTNAQFEDEDTLKRLNISFMRHSRGDVGWDVFSLIYLVDGPVGTIFQPTMQMYQCLFGALWKAKRMEMVLSNMRRQQISMWKVYKTLDQLRPVMHIIHIFTTKLIHFLHQTQYYFLFEVLECSWAEMLRQVQQAECLDDIINAHSTFLRSVESGVLIDENSKELYTKLRAIYNIILSLQGKQELLDKTSTKQLNAYNAYLEKINRKDGFGITKEDEIKEKERLTNFNHFLGDIKNNVVHLANMYDDFLNRYLKLLSSSTNMNLQLLSVRLTSNQRYISST